MKSTRHIQIDIVSGAAPVTRRVMGRTQHLELVQVRVTIDATSGTRHAAFATTDDLDLVRVQTPTWALEALDVIEEELRRSTEQDFRTPRGVHLRAWLRSEIYPLADAPRIPLGDAHMIPTHVDVAVPGQLIVSGHLVARAGSTGKTVTRTYTARNTPPWLATQLTTPRTHAHA